MTVPPFEKRTREEIPEIVVVEDHQDTLKVVGLLLAELVNKGVVIKLCPTPESFAVAINNRRQANFYLIDARLSGVNNEIDFMGIELRKRLIKDKNVPPDKIVIMSSDFESVQWNLLKDGLNKESVTKILLQKPFNRNELEIKLMNAGIKVRQNVTVSDRIG